MADYELYCFVAKLCNLCRAGNKARLTVKCRGGKISINLQLNPLGLAHSGPRLRNSPSRLRHRAHCEQARAEAAAVNAAVHDTAVTPGHLVYPRDGVDAAVQAALIVQPRVGVFWNTFW